MTVIIGLYGSKVNRTRGLRRQSMWPLIEPLRNGKVMSAQVKRIIPAGVPNRPRPLTQVYDCETRR